MIILFDVEGFASFTKPVSAVSVAKSFSVSQNNSPVIITEFMASNNDALFDEDGDSSDWIELHNTTTSGLNLEGWFLTDDAANLTKWQFPSVTIGGNGYLVVFASDKDRAEAGSQLHTNFRLSSSGDYLALVQPDGETIANEFPPTYPEQYGNVSFGLDPNGSQVYFSPATPNAANGTGVQLYQLAPPSTSVGRGFYTSSETVSLTATQGTTIRYTTDATRPSPTHGTIYNGPLTINSTTPLRFLAYIGDGTQPGTRSPVATHTYIFPEDVITQETMSEAIVNAYADQMVDALVDLPTISIVTSNVITRPATREEEVAYVQTSLELIYPDGKPGFQIDAGIKRYGNLSLEYPKNNLRLSFDREFGPKNLAWPLFEGWGQGVYTPAEKFDTIELHSGGSADQLYSAQIRSGSPERASYMGRRYTADTMLDMGNLAPHGYFVHVYHNGIYEGQYHLNERVDADFYIEYAPESTGNDEDYEAVKSTAKQNGNTWSPVDGTGDMWADIIENNGDYDYVKERFDVSAFLDNWIIKAHYRFEHEYRAAGPVDPTDPGVYVIDAPDADRVFPPWGRVAHPPVDADLTAWLGYHDILGALWDSGNQDFRVLFADRIANAHYTQGDLDGVLEASVAEARFNEWRSYIQKSILAEAARWIDDPAVIPAWRIWMDESAVFLTERDDYVLQHIKDRGYFPYEPVTFSPSGSADGDAVWVDTPITINNPNNSNVYYTTDGTDPRLPGNAISPTATKYTGPIELTQSSVIKARPRKNGVWGPIVGDTYHVNPQASRHTLVISEIHYNPDGHDPDPIYASDEYEFLEFKNIGTERIDLTDVTLSQGITFTFPLITLGPGEYMVVVENEDAFASRYQDPTSPYYQPNLTVAGEWDGVLSNGGETLAMRDRDGEEIFTFAYNDGGSWPGRADGNGSSLEVESLDDVPTARVQRNIYLADSDNWQPSSEYHGSPGRAGLGPDNRIVINEVLAASEPPLVDTIEFLNRTTAPINISGWFVSDTSNENNGGFRKYKFPVGTTIASGQYLVIDETNFNNADNPNNPVPFALSSTTGDDVYLMEADSVGNLLRFVDRVEFGASASNESMGLWPDGAVFNEPGANVQTNDLQPMQQHTFGAANDTDVNGSGNAVRAGPVVISEIHYNPAGSDRNLEFIKITNGGTVNESLDNWRLRGEVDVDFGMGITLAPAEFVVVVRFDPNNATLAADFRTTYGLPAQIPLVGPWTNDGETGVRLNNGGGVLKLQRPGALVTPAGGEPFYPMLWEDRVMYDDDAPWVTEPDGNGPSLSRIDLAVYGDDPTNWAATDPPLLTCPESPQPINDLRIGRLGFTTVRLFWTPLQDGTTVEIWRSTQPYFSPGDAGSTLLTTVPDIRNSEDDTTAALGNPDVNHFYVLRTVDVCGNAALSNRVGEFEYTLTETGSNDFSWVGLPLLVDGITLGTGNNASLANHIATNTSQNGASIPATVEAIDRWNNISQSFDSYLPALPFLGGINLQVGGVYRVSVDLFGQPVQNAVWTLLGDVPDISVFTQQLIATGTTNYNWVMVPLNANNLNDSALVIADVQASSTPTVNIVSFDRWNRASQSFDTYLPDFPFAELETAVGHAYRLSLVDGVVPGTVAVWR
ncbi:MAG: lamin tail domain-containing protein [Chloroflexota bacterium]